VDTAGASGFVVRGRVQGVGFRWWVRLRAQELGLRGWVRNTPNGSVEIVVRGDGAALDRFETDLWEGPTSARVDEVVSTAGLVPDDLRPGFEVRF